MVSCRCSLRFLSRANHFNHKISYQPLIRRSKKRYASMKLDCTIFRTVKFICPAHSAWAGQVVCANNGGSTVNFDCHPRLSCSIVMFDCHLRLSRLIVTLDRHLRLSCSIAMFDCHHSLGARARVGQALPRSNAPRSNAAVEQYSRARQSSQTKQKNTAVEQDSRTRQSRCDIIDIE